uniref:FAR1 domain-containing protein n=1 Tax=Aegilops tauschii subsp. strangulata TaxID=200361 RepID=A0A453CFU1_AEGTS
MVCNGVLTDAQVGGQRRRDESPTRSAQSTGRVNPQAPAGLKAEAPTTTICIFCYCRYKLRLGSAPSDRVPCPSRMSALELSMCEYAEQPDKSVVRPELGLSFDSLGEVYDFYNLYSWEIGFGIRYGKGRLKAERTKSMQEIVCGCSGKPDETAGRADASARL